MTELSNAVTVLIARMESHPEDFDTGALDAPRFGHLAPYLTKLAGGGDELAFKHEGSYVDEAFWFLSDADKQALVAAWKQYHYKYFEKRTMEKVFDEDYYTRQEEQRVQVQVMKQQMYQQQMAAQQIKAGGISPLHHNAAQSGYQGLLGQAGNAFSGIFGGSR
jgi:dipeptidase